MIILPKMMSRKIGESYIEIEFEFYCTIDAVCFNINCIIFTYKLKSFYIHV